MQLGSSSEWKLWPETFNRVILQPYLQLISQLLVEPEESQQIDENCHHMRERLERMAFRDIPFQLFSDFLDAYMLTNVYLMQESVDGKRSLMSTFRDALKMKFLYQRRDVRDVFYKTLLTAISAFSKSNVITQDTLLTSRMSSLLNVADLEVFSLANKILGTSLLRVQYEKRDSSGKCIASRFKNVSCEGKACINL